MLSATPLSQARELATAAPEQVGISSERLARIEPWMRTQIASGKYAGMVAMVARHGKIVYLKSVGTLDIETGTRVNDDSLFRIYSMTKPIVSVALMILYEDGRFHLDDAVSKYLPEFKDTKVLADDHLVDQK